MRRPQHVIGLSAGVSILCALAGPARASAPPGAAAQAASPVIVILNDQSASPAAAESPLISQVKAAGGTHVIGYSAVASFAATVTPAEAATLAASPAVASVVPDQKVSVAPATASQVPAAPAGPSGPATGTDGVPPGVCGTPSRPLLPEDLISTHADDAHAQGITGAGVTVAWIADGLDPDNPDFIRGGHSIFKSYVDFSGNGPDTQTGGEEAFGDASMIAAQGNQTYDLSDYVNPAYPLPRNCDIKVEGMAPGASLIGLKAGGELLANSSILQSIDYAITHGANVINESFGANVYSDDNARDTIQLFDDAAVRLGSTVTVSTGDGGISGTQGSPSTDPNVISAGASTDFQSYEQTGYAGARPFSNGRWVSRNVSALSSGGISQRGQVPNLVAPGEADWALCSTNTAIFTECTGYNGQPSPIVLFGGTSEASPVTAGAAALVIQAYREYHDGASPSPALVKQFLTSTASDLGLPAPEQGSGLLNADAAVQAAENYRGSTGGGSRTDQLLVTPQQTTLTGAPAGHVGTTLTVTNAGTGTERVSVGPAATPRRPTTRPTWRSTRRPTRPSGPPPTACRGRTRGSPSRSPATRPGWACPSTGRATRRASPAARSSGSTLIQPDGAFVTNTRPQGATTSANYGFVDVTHPEGGTWTAVLYTPTAAAAVPGQPQPYTGNVILDAYTQRTVPEGSVSPSSLTLGAGQTAQVRLDTAISGSTGDSAESVTLRTPDQQASVPVVLRPVIPITASRGTFTGTITGGNGRAFTPTQTSTYSFDVPGKQNDLDLAVHLNHNPNVVIEGVLIDPDGEAIDVGTNATSADATTGVVSSGPDLQLIQNAPEQGRWRLILIVVDPVSGAEVSQTFHGTIGFNEVTVASNLPASASTRLAAGQAASYTITYGNGGTVAEPVQVDPRLAASGKVTLPSLSGTSTAALPLTVNNLADVPVYEVPPGTSQLTLAATWGTPAQVELNGPLGEPDVSGDLNAAQAGDLTSVARVTEAGGRHQVARGIWGSFVQQIGPFTEDAGTRRRAPAR